MTTRTGDAARVTLGRVRASYGWPDSYLPFVRAANTAALHRDWLNASEAVCFEPGAHERRVGALLDRYAAVLIAAYHAQVWGPRP